jgi:TonB-linked SusC/RagA family outer membrane protein
MRELARYGCRPRCDRGLWWLPVMVLSFLTAFPALALAQTGVVAGTVVSDQSLRPLAGVTVQVEGQGLGAVTDANGRFRIAGVTGTEATLRMMMIGYRTVTQTVPVGATDVRVSLAESAITLEGIVVTGTAGGEERRAIGNSVATINAEEVVATAPIRSMDDLLMGRAAGVVVLPGTGMIGSGSKIRIRGVSTFSLSNDPLIYVDGIRVNHETNSGISAQYFSSVISRINDFDPQQIESIEILKGPAAATLYGTEASRGVINIITKRGAPGGTRYTFSTKQGANWFSNAEGRMPVNYWRDGAGEVHSLNLVTRRNQEGRPLFRTGHLQSYSGSMSGGSEGVRFYVAGDYTQNEGAEPDNYRDQFSGRVNVELAPSDQVNVAASVGYVQNQIGMSCEGGCGGAMFGAVFSTPETLPENFCAAHGNFYGCEFWGGTRIGPAEVYRALELTQDIDRFTASVRMTYSPFAWLTSRFNIGRDLTMEQNQEFLPYQTDEQLIYHWGSANRNGYKFQTRRAQTFDTYDLNTTAAFDVTPSLRSSTSVGVQYYRRNIEFIGVMGRNFAGPGLSTVGAAAIKPYTDEDYLDNNTLGLYVQETLGFNDRLFLTGAVRVDNNSAFGSEVQFVTYPKASLAWMVTEEPAWERFTPRFLDALKLRIAYGHSGTQPTAFAALRTFAPVTGPAGTPAVTPLLVGNPDLRPERGQELEAGFDASMVDGRLGLEFTYYNKRTRDGILLRPTPPSSGFSGSQFYNAGAILNTGMEALVRGSVLTGPRVGLDLTLNLATNSGRVQSLSGADTAIVAGSLQYKIGHDPASWFRERVVSANFDEATGLATDVMCDDGHGGATACYNQFGQVIAPRVFLGRTVPSFEGALSSNLTLNRQFVINAMVDWKTGYRKFNNNHQARCVEFRSCLENIYPERYDPVLIAQIQSGGRLQTAFFEDASFARLREVSLTWNLPESYSRRVLGSRTTAINLAGRNLHTWTGYSGLDPEANYVFGGVTEQSMMPQLTQFVASVNVSF